SLRNSGDRDRRERWRMTASPPCGTARCRQPRYLTLSHETGGFASPPRGGFAYSTTKRSKRLSDQTQAPRNGTIDTALGEKQQPVTPKRPPYRGTGDCATQHPSDITRTTFRAALQRSALDGHAPAKFSNRRRPQLAITTQQCARAIQTVRSVMPPRSTDA